MSGVLVARLDSAGDVLLAGPAIRAVGSHAPVTLLVSSDGEAAARLLPGVERIVVWDCPWTGFTPPPVDPEGVSRLVAAVAELAPDTAVILTSDHQSPLPLALLMRLAGVGHIVATSRDYPGSLLDVRLASDPALHEVEHGLQVAAAAGFTLPHGDPGALAVTDLPPLPDDPDLPETYVVLHPHASVTARSLSPAHAAAVAEALVAAGTAVVLTGSAADLPATRVAAGVHGVVDLVGRTDFGQLGAVLAAARCAVTVNTGPAHLAAAVGLPLVSLFAPVVPAHAWRPWGVPHVVLGDQRAACALTRARVCPLPRHRCLDDVPPAQVVAAVESLTRAEAA